jgi:hypothetical protein
MVTFLNACSYVEYIPQDPYAIFMKLYDSISICMKVVIYNSHTKKLLLIMLICTNHRWKERGKSCLYWSELKAVSKFQFLLLPSKLKYIVRIMNGKTVNNLKIQLHFLTNIWNVQIWTRHYCHATCQSHDAFP